MELFLGLLLVAVLVGLAVGAMGIVGGRRARATARGTEGGMRSSDGAGGGRGTT
jgi:hypothetical protein